MRIGNQSLAKTFIESDITSNDLIAYFDVLIKLFKRYKKKILNTNILEIIKTQDNKLYTIIKLLEHYNKLDIVSIKNISTEIKKQSSDYTPTFTVNIIKHPKKDDIINRLQSKFPKCEVNQQD